ncbi:Leucine-rich repeat serine/threonine-protein kinase 2 [Phytophthora pseudosyringae]|uniref:Leucine-rich repeat serine/threonine-protein kinase 2 n=1 Tax=Phytophthora pseudosyringae TaxID=221518 RepID=A0A8T1V7T2_9STRA|nr:Leucine-rich repeat serine/threonine-protein kinase 2 [Phytophthora pseudosyringae]
MLTDFGMSFFASGSCSVQAKRSSLGAMQWRAPEFVCQTAADPSFDSDVYSLGMCIIQAVQYAKYPWGNNLSSDEIRTLLCEGKPVVIDQPAEMTAPQWELVQRMIAFDRGSRPDLNEEILPALEQFANTEADAEAYDECPY